MWPTLSFMDIPRRAVSTRVLVAFAAEHGLAPERALAGTGLVAAELDDPDTTMDGAQELIALRNVVRALGDVAGLGVRVGRRFSLSSHGDLGFALLTCATGRDAVALALRYFETSDALITPRLLTDGADLVLHLDCGRVPADLRPFALERDVTAIVTVMEAILPGAVLRIRLDLPAERVAQVAAAAPGHQVAFGAASQMRLRGAGLDRPLPGADVAVARTFERRLQERRRPTPPRSSTAVRTRAALLDALPARASAQTAAAALHLSPRTLRRRLAEEGTSFQQVADTLLQELAVDLLRQDLSVTEVAARLGYAEIASFTRAFRRWTGLSPRAWARTAAHPDPDQA
jgi:AraC-like DNA-binding protein